MPRLEFVAVAEGVELRAGEDRAVIGLNITKGAIEVLCALQDRPGVWCTRKALFGDVREDTVRGWIQEAADFLQRSRQVSLPGSLRRILDGFEMGDGRPGVLRRMQFRPPGRVSAPTPSSLVHRTAKVELLYVAGGSYRRGRYNTAFTDQRPEHGARLSPFLLARWPVSKRQYLTFVREFEEGLSQGTERATALVTALRVVWEEGRRYACLTDELGAELRWGDPDGSFPRDIPRRLRRCWNDGLIEASRDSDYEVRRLPAGFAAAVEHDDAPAVGLDWFCIQAWLGWHRLSLPPEAVWEYAAMGAGGGDRPEVAPMTDEPESAPTLVLVGAPEHEGSTSILGFRAMVGNCWEVCDDWYAPYPGAEGAPPRWNPRGPSRPPAAEEGEALPYRCVRGGSWETTEARAHYKARGGNHISWRSPWDTFRPYAALDYRFLAWHFDLPANLEARAEGHRDSLLALLDPPRGDHSLPASPTDWKFDKAYLVRAQQRRQAFLRAVEAAAVEDLQASLVDLDGGGVIHALKRGSMAEIPGLTDLVVASLAGAQSRPCGGFSWVDDRDELGGVTAAARLSHCAWSRVPGSDELLLVESHLVLPTEPFGPDHELFGWLRRAGWADRRTFGAHP